MSEGWRERWREIDLGAELGRRVRFAPVVELTFALVEFTFAFIAFIALVDLSLARVHIRIALVAHVEVTRISLTGRGEWTTD